MSTRAANRAIATYLLQAAGLDEPTAQIMIGVMKIDTPGQILAVTSEQLLAGDKIGVGDAVDVLSLQKFIKTIIKRRRKLPLFIRRMAREHKSDRVRGILFHGRRS